MDSLTTIIEEEPALALSIDVKLIASRMEEGFKSNDRRFDAVESRFNRVTGLISLGFITMTILITVFQFLA